MNLRKAIRTVKLTRRAAWESGGSIVKGGFIGGEVYRYDAVNGNEKCTDFGNRECSDIGNSNAPISVTTIHNFR